MIVRWPPPPDWCEAEWEADDDLDVPQPTVAVRAFDWIIIVAFILTVAAVVFGSLTWWFQ